MGTTAQEWAKSYFSISNQYADEDYIEELPEAVKERLSTLISK